MVSGHHQILDGIMYILAQMCGSLLGAMMLAATIPSDKDYSGAFATNSVQSGFSDSNAFWGEFFMTGLLLFVVYHTAVRHDFEPADPVEASDLEKRRSGIIDAKVSRKSVFANKARQWAPLSIGMAVFVAHCVLVPITGCSINPARTLGPLIVGEVRGLPNDDPWNDLWIFMVAPQCAALVCGILFPLLWRMGYLEVKDTQPKLPETTTEYQNPVHGQNPPSERPAGPQLPTMGPQNTETRQKAEKKGFRGSYDKPAKADSEITDHPSTNNVPQA